MEIIVVSDTNILIDLIETGLLEQFFLLPMKVHTTDIVISEVTVPEQKAQVKTLVQTRCLTVKAFAPDEMLRLIDFVNSRRRRCNLRIADFSVWQYASENNYILLTGDGNLRKLAAEDGVEVHGTIYIFDQMVEHKVLTPAIAADRLELLYNINHRLPKPEIDLRIEKWRGSL